VDHHADIQEVLFPAEAIRARVAELGAAISRDYAGKDLLLVCVLRGAVFFATDLARAITIPMSLDFLAISSYGAAAGAAASLGARPARVFWRVTLPLSMPGVVSGSLIVFAWTFSAFPTPELLGGGKVKMIANVVKDLALDSFNWPGAAAFAMLALAVTLALLAGLSRFAAGRAP
jgi:ABC-type sulfate transport system permease subunit